MTLRSSRIRRLAVIVLACAMVIGGHSESGALDLSEIRSDVAGAGKTHEPSAPKSKSHSKSKRRNSDDHDACDDGLDDEISSALGLASLAALTSPFWGPKKALHDSGGHPGFFARYPYREPGMPYLLDEFAEESYGWLFRGRLEYGDEFSTMSHFGGQILLDTAIRLGIDSELYVMEEDLGAAGTDRMYRGDANLVYRFAQSSAIQMRTGIGLNWMDIGTDIDTGFNFTYSGDWFPADPWIMSAELDWGRIGEAGIFHGRLTTGIHYHRLELFTGYDYVDIGDTQIGNVVAGIRLWQ